MLNGLIILFAATAALVIRNLPSMMLHVGMWLQLNKVSGWSPAKWAYIGWILIGEPIYLSLVIVALRLHLAKQDLKLFYLGVLVRHQLLEQS